MAEISSMSFRRIVRSCLILFVAAGCFGSSSGRLSFSGRITGTKQPIDGSITLVPMAKGPIASTVIKQGQYAFVENNGPIPGNYEVTIEQAAVNQKKGAVAEDISLVKWRTSRTFLDQKTIQPDFDLGQLVTD